MPNLGIKIFWDWQETCLMYKQIYMDTMYFFVCACINGQVQKINYMFKGIKGKKDTYDMMIDKNEEKGNGKLSERGRR